MVHDKKNKGDLGVVKAIADLTEKGYFVFVPVVTEHLPFDLIAYKDFTTYRVQCKYVSDGFIRNKTSWSSKQGSHSKKYHDNDFDYYAIYLPQIDKMVYPHITLGGVTINYKVPNSTVPFYWWEDFIDFTIDVKKKTYIDFNLTINDVLSDRFKETHKTGEIKPYLRKPRPTKEELQNLVWEMPSIHIAKKYNVSDVTIYKWCKELDIKKPSRGYWSKK